jgi:hypothetical protein
MDLTCDTTVRESAVGFSVICSDGCKSTGRAFHIRCHFVTYRVTSRIWQERGELRFDHGVTMHAVVRFHLVRQK